MTLWKLWLSALFLSSLTLLTAAFSLSDSNLHLINCDVGQGDGAILVHKNMELIIDGGPNNNFIDCLSKHMPFWDRTIELVILSHPQADHFQGLIEVFKRYKVEKFLISGLSASTKEFGVLENVVGGSTTQVLTAREGMQMRVGSIYLDILSPSEKLIIAKSQKTEAKVLGAFSSKADPNKFSVVALLSFNQFDALFTGDIDPEIEKEILLSENLRPVEYIKVPHHGSKNGLEENFLNAFHPEVALISAGKNNSYGHPHKEILDLLEKYKVKVFRTDQDGEIEIVTNGKDYWLK
jgi:competence protein ComEC